MSCQAPQYRPIVDVEHDLEVVLLRERECPTGCRAHRVGGQVGAGDRERAGRRERRGVGIRGLETHVGAILAIENVRKALGVLDAEQNESREPPRVGLHGADVDALGGQGFADEAAHVLVADAGQHGHLEPQPRKTDGDISRGAAEVLGEMLGILEPRPALEAIEVDGRATQANEVDAAGGGAHARGLPPPAAGGSQIVAPGFIVQACSGVNSGTS